jgi:uncharacterized membrane protein
MTEAVTSKRVRIESVDVVRGVIIIIMALDHVRDYFSNPGFDPTDLTRTNVAFFFTRWIKHFCAPVFFLLTGTGAYLSLRKQSQAQLSRFSVYSRRVANLSGTGSGPLPGLAL